MTAGETRGAPVVAAEDIEDIGSNPDPRRPIGALIAQRLDRRAALRGLIGAGAAVGLAERLLCSTAALAQAPGAAHSSGNTSGAGISTLRFPELRHQSSQGDAVAEGHEIQTVLRWGDPILPDAPEFDPSARAPMPGPAVRYNCDYLDFFPLPKAAATATTGCSR